MKFIILLLSLLIVGISEIYAQQKIVTGKVTDFHNGDPLAGATVLIRGTLTGVATDNNGNFSIIAGENDELIFSFVGMKRETVSVKNKTHIAIALRRISVSVGETLVVAFGDIPVKDYTGAASVIRRDELENRSLTNVLYALEGATPGVQLNGASGQPGSSPDIRIRGFGSLNASSTPLIIVDGAPYSGNISSINPGDIDNISILKDASSASLYGNRGANGIILITTRKGNKEHFSYKVKVSQGISTPTLPEYEKVNAYDYYPMMWEAYRNSMVYRKDNPLSREAASEIASRGNTTTDNITTLLGVNPFNVPDNEIVGTDGKLNPNARLLYPGDLDWRDAMIRSGHRQDYNLSAEGGSEKVDYYLSLGYTDEKGYILKSRNKRITARANINLQAKHWFRSGLNLSTTMHESSITDVEKNTGYINPFYFSRNIGPIYPMHKHNTDGSYELDAAGNSSYDWIHRASGAFNGRHIVAETEWNDNSQRQNVMNGRAYAEIHLIRGLKFTFNAAYDLTNNLAADYKNPKVGDAAGSGRSKKTNDRYDVWNFNQLLSFNRAYKGHHLDILLGHESFSNTYKLLYGQRDNIISEGNDELDNFTKTTYLSSYTNRYTTEGYFSRLNYSYSNKYFLSLSYRRDGSSRFHPDARWGNFWSAGVAWQISRETFINRIEWIDNLKLRSSYGETGNDQTDSWFAWQSLYDIMNNGSAAGFLQNTATGNKRLKWEANAQFDVALEFGLFKKIRGTLEFFNRTSKDLLFSVPQPLSNGVLTQWQNIGSMYNKGVEFQIAADIFTHKNFKWMAGLLLTHFKNKITELPQKEISAGFHKRIVGSSIYDYWLKDFAGVDPENGDALYRMDIADEQGNITGITTTNDINKATSYYCGTAIPKFYGSFNNSLTFKRLELFFRFTFQYGGKTYDDAYANLMNSGLYGKALHQDMLKRWQNPGDQTNVPRLDNGNDSNLSASSSRWLTDASFLTLKNLTLSYNLPEKIPFLLDIESIRFYLSGENLFMLSHRKGMNPQNSFNGVSNNAYSPARLITIGVNVEF